MTDGPSRVRLTAAQVAVMVKALTHASPSVLDAADRVERGEVIPDEDADAVVNALVAAMLDTDESDGRDLTARSREIDDIVGIVQQMSEHFYD